MAQVYPSIANPYMPNGTADKTNSPSPAYAPGEIGCTFTDQNTGGKYLRVYLDSGATSATPVGAPVQGQVAYWKSGSGAVGVGGGGASRQSPTTLGFAISVRPPLRTALPASFSFPPPRLRELTEPMATRNCTIRT